MKFSVVFLLMLASFCITTAKAGVFFNGKYQRDSKPPVFERDVPDYYSMGTREALLLSNRGVGDSIACTQALL